MKIWANIKTNSVLLAVVALSVFSFVSLVRAGYFPMHDDMQVMRLYELERCFADGQIPCRWVPDQGYGYGYPQFNFYSPLPYYVMYLFRLVGFSYLACVKIGFILSLFLSALAMFALGRWLWGNLGGAVSALFYLYAPYRAMDVYNRGAMAEAWAFVFLPLIFLSVGRWINRKHSSDLVLLSLGLAGLFLSHNVTTLITIPFGLGWVLVWWWRKKDWSTLRGLVLAGFLGIGLAAFFLLPAFFEKKFVHVETMLMGYFNYLAHFVSLEQLFVSTRWGYGSSVLGPNEQVALGVGVFFWLFGFAGLVVGWGRSWRQKSFRKVLALFVAVAFLVSVGLVHQRSVFTWHWFDFLKWLQFPWRFLTLSIFFQAILAGFGLTLLERRRDRVIIAGLAVSLVMFTSLAYFYPKRWIEITDEEKLSGANWEEQQKISIFDYLPIWAQMPPGERAPAQPWAISGEVEVVDFQKGTDWQSGQLNVVGEAARVRLPLYYFPGMSLRVDGAKTDFTYDNYLGLITFNLPEGDHSFRVKLKDTPVRTVGNIWTLVSAVGLVALVGSKKVRQKGAKLWA